MKQFNLEEWLKDKGRKVVTREGRPVRIVCWDLKSNTPIIAAIQWNQEREDCYCYNTIGRCANNVGELDLFFEDKEEELTELQKTLEEDCDCYVNLYNDGKTREELREWIKDWCPRIIDLARKQLESNYYDKVLGDKIVFKSELHATDLQTAYDMGKQDALKDLPKWRKATKNKHFANRVLLFKSDNRIVLTAGIYKDEYYIELNDLKALTKEE